jgi:HD-like signal output (HDOD) protein
VFCLQCGNKNSDKARYCNHCGVLLSLHHVEEPISNKTNSDRETRTTKQPTVTRKKNTSSTVPAQASIKNEFFPWRFVFCEIPKLFLAPFYVLFKLLGWHGVQKIHSRPAKSLKPDSIMKTVEPNNISTERITTPIADNELKTYHIKVNPFFNDFNQHFISGELKIPSFPDVALKMRKAFQEDAEVVDIAKIVNMDPAVSARLIRVVNSPVYMRINPISNCLNAINRLGLSTTRNLVIAFSMKNLIKSENKAIEKLIQDNWLQSITVSSICYTLAQLTKKVDPDEALLAGLLHNIGVLPILTFADSLPADTYQFADIDLCINEIYGQLGSIILEKWGFPDKLKQIPLQSANWFESTPGDINLADIVILAKYHNLVESAGKAELPLIDTLPAFQKLGNQSLSPEMSLQILYDAKHQIAETMLFFSN